jgi:plasmid stability protein
MARLLIRDLPEVLVLALEERAAANGGTPKPSIA